MLREQFRRLPVTVDSAVYSEPHETPEGSTIITVARVGVLGRARPIGLFVVHDGHTTWTPAFDGSRVAVIGVLTGLLSAVIGTLAVLRRPPWPDLRITRRV